MSAIDRLLETLAAIESGSAEQGDTLLARIIAEETARANADNAHLSAPDPHPQYLTGAEGNAAYATAAQGDKADTAVQPADLAAVATSGAYADLIDAPVIGIDTQAHDADLDAIAALTGTGYAKRTGADTWALSLTVPWSDLTGTPTTLAGYGITDAATSAQGTLADSAIQPGDDAADLGSGAATNGYVLTADGAGNAAWGSIPAGVTDHGALSGLSDDDHTQYALADGTRGAFLRPGTAISVTSVTCGNFYASVLEIDFNSTVAFKSGFYHDTGNAAFNSANVYMTALPTSDPLEIGRLWNDAGTLKISAG